MIEVKFNTDALENKLHKVASNLYIGTSKGLNISLEESKKYAQNKLRFNTDNKILTERNDGNGVLVGRIYTDSINFSYAPFVEYGTGEYAEMPHIGKTRLFKYSGMTCWYAPADKVRKQYSDNQYMEINGEMFPMNSYINGEKYVMVFSQKAQPFMRTTAFERREPNKKVIKEEIKKSIKEAIK